MRAWVVFLVSLLGAHVLEASLLQRLLPAFLLVDLVLVALAFQMLRNGRTDFVLGAGLFGALRQGAAGEPLFTGFLGFAAVAWFLLESGRRLVGESAVTVLVLLFASVLIHDMFTLAPSIVHGVLPMLLRFLLVTVPAGIVTGAVGVLVWETNHRLRAARENA